MKSRISVCSPSFSKNNYLTNQLIESFPNWKIQFCTHENELKLEDLKSFLSCSTMAIIGKEKINADLLKHLPSLQAISKYGVGLDNIDFDACRNHRVKVFHTPGVNASGVAEHTLGLMINCLRNISLSNRLLRQGVWKKNGGTQLYAKTVGIVGCGAVGRALAKLLQAFQCNVLVCDLTDQSDFCHKLPAQQLDFYSLLNRSDIISLHVPLTSKTYHMINDESIQLIRPHALLCNTSRGGVVKLDCVIDALNNQRLGGFAVDVYSDEPFLDTSFHNLENVLSTPHIAGNSVESVQAMGIAAINGLRDFIMENRE